MPSLLTHIICRDCGHEMPPDPMKTKCDECDSQWLLSRYDTVKVREIWESAEFQYRDRTLWRYEELLPVGDPNAEVSMGEGWTPLVRAHRLQKELGLKSLWIKDERQSPTGCFKDRQAVMNVALLKERKVAEVVLASTGNKGTAFAAYVHGLAFALGYF